MAASCCCWACMAGVGVLLSISGPRGQPESACRPRKRWPPRGVGGDHASLALGGGTADTSTPFWPCSKRSVSPLRRQPAQRPQPLCHRNAGRQRQLHRQIRQRTPEPASSAGASPAPSAPSPAKPAPAAAKPERPTAPTASASHAAAEPAVLGTCSTWACAAASKKSWPAAVGRALSGHRKRPGARHGALGGRPQPAQGGPRRDPGRPADRRVPAGRGVRHRRLRGWPWRWPPGGPRCRSSSTCPTWSRA